MCCLIHSVALVKKCIVCGAETSESTDINNANISFHGLVKFRIYSSNRVSLFVNTKRLVKLVLGQYF